MESQTSQTLTRKQQPNISRWIRTMDNGTLSSHMHNLQTRLCDADLCLKHPKMVALWQHQLDQVKAESQLRGIQAL